MYENKYELCYILTKTKHLYSSEIYSYDVGISANMLVILLKY